MVLFPLPSSCSGFFVVTLPSYTLPCHQFSTYSTGIRVYSADSLTPRHKDGCTPHSYDQNYVRTYRCVSPHVESLRGGLVRGGGDLPQEVRLCVEHVFVERHGVRVGEEQVQILERLREEESLLAVGPVGPRALGCGDVVDPAEAQLGLAAGLDSLKDLPAPLPVHVVPGRSERRMMREREMGFLPRSARTGTEQQASSTKMQCTTLQHIPIHQIDALERLGALNVLALANGELRGKSLADEPRRVILAQGRARGRGAVDWGDCRGRSRPTCWW